MDKKIKVTSPR